MRPRPLRPTWLILLLPLLILAGSGVALRAQTNPAPDSLVGGLSMAELVRMNLHLQEQLHAAQLAIERTRLESQEAARAQAAAITERLNLIQGALEAERARRADEAQRANRTLLWVAASFGGVGLLAMVLTALFQYRAMNRALGLATVPAALPSGAAPALLPAPDGGGTPGKSVTVSNQRLMSIIERLERRVLELEQPAPARAGTAVPDERNARLAALMERGQALLNGDKAAEALACFDEALRLAPDHPEALVKKGAALERLGQDEEALRCYDRAIAADQSLTLAYLYKGGIHNRHERYNEALECYEQALRAQGAAR
ncbi:MAG: tetratricopeptide repeat protein [Limisphaerales bacterium]